MNPKTLLNHKRPPPLTIPKACTGIDGFDDITNGGLPRGRTTLFEGGPGSGKTIMALQTLVNGARLHDEPGIFVAFEESAERITINASKFGWDLQELQKRKLFFLDAQPSLDLVQSGTFDLGGMLAALAAKAAEIKAKRVVFDAVDVVLALMRDPAAEQREVYRLHEWLLASGLTGVLTAKGGGYQAKFMNQQHLGFMQFMVDCSVVLNHDVVEGVSQRNLRVVKYRGANFAENESPFLIGDAGMEVAGAREWSAVKIPPTRERVSSGVPRLDAMLGGGYYRNSSVLITGVPGTAKSTLCGTFAESACLRGEKTLYVSFDSDADEVVRNLTSVNVRLERFIKRGAHRPGGGPPLGETEAGPARTRGGGTGSPAQGHPGRETGAGRRGRRRAAHPDRVDRIQVAALAGDPEMHDEPAPLRRPQPPEPRRDESGGIPVHRDRTLARAAAS
jgi:circadian clock protein KaiC